MDIKQYNESGIKYIYYDKLSLRGMWWRTNSVNWLMDSYELRTKCLRKKTIENLMTGGWLHLDFAVMDYYVFLNPTCVFMDICAVIMDGVRIV